MVTRRQKDRLGRGKKKKPVVTESLSHTSVQTVAKESWCTVRYEQIFDSKVRWGPQHPALNLNFLMTVSAYVLLSFFGCFHLSDMPWLMLNKHLKVFIKMYRLHLKKSLLLVRSYLNGFTQRNMIIDKSVWCILFAYVEENEVYRGLKTIKGNTLHVLTSDWSQYREQWLKMELVGQAHPSSGISWF